MRGTWKALVALPVLILSVGCGDGRPKLVPVSGRVLIDGQSLEHGHIRVHPENYRPASGKLGPHGRFELSTYQPGDGSVPGRHPVTINGVEAINKTSWRWHAPKKYRDVKTSGLEIEIGEPTDSAEIEISWSGGKPFVETIQSTGD